MSTQVYSVPDQTEGGKEGLFEVEKHRFILKTISYILGQSYLLSFHHPIPTLSVRIGNALAVFKTNQ